jgi:hypothetical protein
LIEVASHRQGYTAEPSYGTHFFQDLVETRIYPLAVYPDDEPDFLNTDFLARAHNQIDKHLSEPAGIGRCIKVIHIPTERPGYHLEVFMDGQRGLGFLSRAAAQARSPVS